MSRPVYVVTDTTEQGTALVGVWEDLREAKKAGQQVVRVEQQEPGFCVPWTHKNHEGGCYYGYWADGISHYLEIREVELNEQLTHKESAWDKRNKERESAS